MKIYAGDALCINIIRREVGTKTRSSSVTSARSVMMLSVRSGNGSGTLLVYKAANFEQRCNATEAIRPPLTLPFFNLLQNDLRDAAVTYAARTPSSR